VRRREVITVLGGAAAAWPLAGRAQQTKMPTIGFLGAGSGSDSVWKDWTVVQRLRELGWVEGRTVVIEYRWGEGRAERYADLAAEFVALKVDVEQVRALWVSMAHSWTKLAEAMERLKPHQGTRGADGESPR
jgi:putative ABC transport system substrate-binding protein